MLLNVCCAPCSLPIIEYLLDPAVNADPVTLFFYGPNIFPEAEYAKRLREARKIAEIYGLQMYEGEYDHDRWLSYVKENLPEPPENYPENGDECLLCFQYRLNETAAFARSKGFDGFGTTLSVSRFKDVFYINQYGKSVADKNALIYRTFPLNAEEAHRKGIELSKKHNIYRQKYCGCEFSLPKQA